eukprot:scaffold56832_cov45-Attheya_sp.AAC.2
MMGSSPALTKNGEHCDHIMTSQPESKVPPTPKEVPKKKDPKWIHRPIVQSLLYCSMLGNREDVQAVCDDCIKNGDDSIMCEAASKYFQMCFDHDNDIIRS